MTAKPEIQPWMDGLAKAIAQYINTHDGCSVDGITVILRQHEMEKLTMTAKPEIQPWMIKAGSDLRAEYERGCGQIGKWLSPQDIAAIIAAHAPEQDPLTERELIVIGRLACEMGRLPKETYGEMLDALNHAIHAAEKEQK